MTTYDSHLLEKYAELVIKVSLNLRSGQRLMIRGVPVQLAPLVRLLTKYAYLAGARYVDVQWSDQELDRLRLAHSPLEALGEFPDWRVQATLEYCEAGDATLGIFAEDPEYMANEDPQAINKVQKVRAEKMAPFFAHTSRFSINWSVISGSTGLWARKVFPELNEEEAVSRLWDTIFEVCRVKDENPVASWEKHLNDLAERQDYLTAKAYQKLHYQAPSTDLTVGLPAGHLWLSGSLTAKNGVKCVANMPTEEVFTIPHKDRIDGTVSSTKPLSFGGITIDNFSLTFDNGRVVNAFAEKGQVALDALLETDEGALSLGEAALVPHSSPISQSNLLFYNTLYDENASSHLALGYALRPNLAGGSDMSAEDFLAAGGNYSLIHEDFMIGSAEMDIDGYLADGSAEPLMRSGEWAFDI